jgi:hypothetical protein
LCKRGELFSPQIGLDTAHDFGGGQHTLRFHDGPLAVDPVWFDGIQPGALDGQATGQRADPAVALDLLVMLPNLGPHCLAHMPGDVVPDEHQHPLPLPRQACADPRQEGGGDLADWTAVDKAQEEVTGSGPPYAIAAEGFRLGIPRGEDRFDQSQGRLCGPAVQSGVGQPAPPGLVGKAQDPI